MAYKIMGITSSPFYTNMMIYYLMCDTPADLPSTISDIGYGTVIGYGSRADIISDSSKYLWNGSQWVRQTTGGGGGGASSADQVSYDNTDSGLTATNVQDAIDELHDTDETQDNALVELSGENADQQLEIDYAINTGSKNLLKNIRTTTTNRGITFTVNDDGSVTANGTNDGTGASVLNINTQSTLVLDNGEYILSGCPTGGSETGYMMDITRSPGSSLKDIGDGISFRVGGDYTVNEFRIVISRNITVNNLTFYPMIRNSVIRNSTFEPYAPTNRELYEISQTKADKESFDLTIAGSPLVASEYSYSCIVTGDIVTICVRIILAEELAVNTSRNLFFIPSPYYPPVPCAGAGYADGKVRTFWVNQYGTIKIRIDEAIPAGANLNANFCYSYKNADWTTVTANQLQSLNSPLMLNREEITPLETDVIKETEEINEIEETE